MNKVIFFPAINAVARELKYQDEVWGKVDPESESGTGAFDRSLDEYTLYINRYAQRLAAENCTGPTSFEAKMHTVRKIAALAIACMSEHGSLTREHEEREKFDGDSGS